MQKKSIFIVLCFLFLFSVSTAYSQPKSDYLEQGIKQYSVENYDEAIVVLEKARAINPKSSAVAYYLGMAYKQTTEYDKALKHLEDATTLSPPVKEAVSEYLSVLYQLNRFDDAQKWISKAESENIDPANTSYWKGMVLAKKNQCNDAIAPLEKAKELNSKLAQSADYEIGLCHYNERQMDKANERFKATVAYDPTSDLATNSRRYQEIIEKNRFSSRPLRITLGLYGGYDSNLVSKPSNEIYTLGIQNPESGFLKPSLRVEFVPRLKSPWLFSAMYAFNSTYNQNHVHSQDSMANTVTVLPGYNFGRFSVSFLASYTSYLLRSDPDLIPDEQANLKRYLEYGTVGPVVRILATQNNILELFLGFDKKEFYNQKRLPEYTHNRDAIGPRAYISWTWFYWDKGFLTLRYDYSRDLADGVYWDSQTHRLSGNINVPLLPDYIPQKFGYIYLQATGSYANQGYTYEQPAYNISWAEMNRIKRTDHIYNASIGLNWEIMKNMGIVLQYKYVKADSNIPVYEYNDNIYTAGIEFKF